MGRGLVRTVLAPAVLVGAVVLAVRPTSEPPAPAEPVEAPLFRGSVEQSEAAAALWAAWGEDLTADGRLPEALAALEAEEAVYVLLTTRAAQVAEAVAAAPGSTPDDALAAVGLAPQPLDVRTAQVPRIPGCVVLEFAREVLGRDYYGWAAAPEEPGPDPVSPLERLLLRTARIGLGPADEPRCGAGVAYSPPAQEAVAALRPALLG